MSRAPTATTTTQQLAHRRVFVVRMLPVRVAAALKAPKRPKKNLKFGKPVLEPYLDNQSVFFGGILLWLASPALALIPCQPGMVRSIADRFDGSF